MAGSGVGVPVTLGVGCVVIVSVGIGVTVDTVTVMTTAVGEGGTVGTGATVQEARSRRANAKYFIMPPSRLRRPRPFSPPHP